MSGGDLSMSAIDVLIENVTSLSSSGNPLERVPGAAS